VQRELKEVKMTVQDVEEMFHELVCAKDAARARVQVRRWSLPYLTLPYLTLPFLTSSYLILPYLTLPYLTLPYLTLPYLTLPYLTFPYRHLSFPYHN